MPSPVLVPGASASARREPTFLGHPLGLAFLAFSETWERFSYYGMQSLLVLYMVSQLLLPGHVENVAGLGAVRVALEQASGPLSIQAFASALFGIYAGAVYLTPILGGLLADRLLGRRRTVILGALLMVAGHALMAFEQPFLLALLFLVLGTGCFKGNIAAQVGALYPPDDRRRDGAFQIFYLGITVGAIASPLVCGTLGEVLGWHWGFGAAAVGMVVGLAIYLAGARHLPGEHDRTRSAPRTPKKRLAGHDLSKVVLLVVLLPILALEAVGNQQIFNGYMVWARDNADLTLRGLVVPTTWLVTLDTTVGVVTLVGSLAFWRMWARRRPEPDDLTKIAGGAVIAALALLMLVAAAAHQATSGEKVPLAWLIGFHVLNGISFANVFPVALALFSRAAPAALGSTMIGVYYLQLVICNLLVGWLGGLLDRMTAVEFWGLHAGLVGASAVLLIGVKLMFGRLLDRPAN